MRIRYNEEKLREILGDLHELTGVSISFLDTDYKSLCRYVREDDFCSAYQKDPERRRRCQCSDEELLVRCGKSGGYEWHLCPAGLYDAIFPVVKDSLTVGYILMGRVRCPESSFCTEHPRELLHLYEEVPLFQEKQLTSLRTLLYNILFSPAVEIEYEETSREIKEYIKENLAEEISVSSICDRFFLSKNHLYRIFRENDHCTVNEYITRCRMAKAKKFLKETDAPVCDICETVGIPNYTYFCRLFKKREGQTPTQFRKEVKG